MSIRKFIKEIKKKKESQKENQIVEVHIYVHQAPCGFSTPTTVPQLPYVTFFAEGH